MDITAIRFSSHLQLLNRDLHTIINIHPFLRGLPVELHAIEGVPGIGVMFIVSRLLIERSVSTHQRSRIRLNTQIFACLNVEALHLANIINRFEESLVVVAAVTVINLDADGVAAEMRQIEKFLRHLFGSWSRSMKAISLFSTAPERSPGRSVSGTAKKSTTDIQSWFGECEPNE